MLDIPLQAGDIVAGLEPDEHVEIRRVVPFGSRMLVEGIGVTSRREIRRPLSSEDLAQLTKVRGADYTFDGDAEPSLQNRLAALNEVVRILRDPVHSAAEKKASAPGEYRGYS